MHCGDAFPHPGIACASTCPGNAHARCDYAATHPKTTSARTCSENAHTSIGCVAKHPKKACASTCPENAHASCDYAATHPGNRKTSMCHFRKRPRSPADAESSMRCHTAAGNSMLLPGSLHRSWQACTMLCYSSRHAALLQARSCPPVKTPEYKTLLPKPCMCSSPGLQVTLI